MQFKLLWRHKQQLQHKQKEKRKKIFVTPKKQACDLGL